MITQKQIGTSHVVMPLTKIQGFLREFPWIEKCIDGPLSAVYVSKLELSMLQYSGEKHEKDVTKEGCIAQYMEQREIFYLLDEAGEYVKFKYEEVVLRRKHIFSKLRPTKEILKCDGWFYYKSTLLSLVENANNETDKIRFVVSYYPYTEAVILYKLPNGVSLRQLVEKLRLSVEDEIQTASTGFREAVTEIDNIAI